MNTILDFRSTPAPSPQLHLTDDQIDDLLMGDLLPLPAAHLAACSRCTERVAEASDLLSSFQTVTMAWSERRSATLPPLSRPLHRHLWQRRSAWVTACVGFAVGLAVINLPHTAAPRQDGPRPLQIAISQQPAPQLPPLADLSQSPGAPPAAPSQVSADNQMLQAIDDELHAAPNSPSVLGLAPVTGTSNWPAATTSIQD